MASGIKFPSLNPNLKPKSPFNFRPVSGLHRCSSSSRREAISVVSVTLALTLANSNALSENLEASLHPPSPPPRKQVLDGICSTKNWFQFFGDGFSIRVPPQFENIMEPEVQKFRKLQTFLVCSTYLGIC